MSVTVNLANESYRVKHGGIYEQIKAPTELVCAKNDSAAFQVVLSSDLHYSVSFGDVDWFSHTAKPFAAKVAGKHERVRVVVDSPFETELHHVGLVTDDDLVKKGDILLNQNTIETPADSLSALWCEVLVPKDAAAGNYTIKVSVFAALYEDDEALVKEFTLPLQVADYTLPDKRGLYLNLWFHPCSIARKHDVVLWSDEHFEILRKYVKSLAKLGQKPIIIVASDIPWKGQDCWLSPEANGNLFEYSPIKITKNLDGSFEFDFSIMQRYIDMCTEEGLDGFIEIIGLTGVWFYEKFIKKQYCPEYHEALTLHYIDKADGSRKYLRDAEVIKAYIKALGEYFVKTGQKDRVRIAADEPADIEKYRYSIQELKKLMPDFKYACAINHVEFIDEFKDDFDESVPYLRCVAQNYESLAKYKKLYPDKKFSWYVCCGRAPLNTFILCNLLESRAIGTMTSFLRFDGFVRWAYTLWNDNPRNDARYSLFEAGDCYFVYPGAYGGPLLSLRYKNLLRGMVDYDLLEAVRKKKGDDTADRFIKRICYFDHVSQLLSDEKKFKKTEELYCVDWETYNQIKKDMLKILAD